MAITPNFPGVCRRGTSTLLQRALVCAASRMRLNLIRWTPDDVDVAAVRLPAEIAGSEMLVGIGQAAIMLFLGGINGRFRLGIAALPEDFFILVTLLVCR